MVDNSTGMWHKPLIDGICAQDAQNTISMPFYSSNKEDKLTWKLRKDGLLSVKSAYDKG